MLLIDLILKERNVNCIKEVDWILDSLNNTQEHMVIDNGV